MFAEGTLTPRRAGNKSDSMSKKFRSNSVGQLVKNVDKPAVGFTVEFIILI
jgi:hypothetical protein